MGPRVQSLRRTRKLSQKVLGQRLGVPQSHISDIERGLKNVSVEMLVRLAQVLDCDPGALLPTIEELRARFGADLAELWSRPDQGVFLRLQNIGVQHITNLPGADKSPGKDETRP